MNARTPIDNRPVMREPDQILLHRAAEVIEANAASLKESHSGYVNGSELRSWLIDTPEDMAAYEQYEHERELAMGLRSLAGPLPNQITEDSQ